MSPAPHSRDRLPVDSRNANSVLTLELLETLDGVFNEHVHLLHGDFAAVMCSELLVHIQPWVGRAKIVIGDRNAEIHLSVSWSTRPVTQVERSMAPVEHPLYLDLPWSTI